MESNSSFCNEPNGKSCSNGKTLSVSGKASSSVEFWQRAEIGVLCLVVVILWGLLSLPVVFYHLPSGDDESGSTESRQVSIISNNNYYYECAPVALPPISVRITIRNSVRIVTVYLGNYSTVRYSEQ